MVERDEMILGNQDEQEKAIQGTSGTKKQETESAKPNEERFMTEGKAKR